MGGRVSRTGWWYVKLKPQNDSVLRLRRAPSRSAKIRVSFLVACRSPVVPRQPPFDERSPRQATETRVFSAPTRPAVRRLTPETVVPRGYCPRDDHIMHRVTEPDPVLGHLLPEQVFPPRLTFAKTASEAHLHDDDPPVRHQYHVRFRRIIVAGASRPEQHFHVFPVHPIKFKATNSPLIEMFHAFQETREVRLPRQVIENAEEVARQDVLAILPVAKWVRFSFEWS